MEGETMKRRKEKGWREGKKCENEKEVGRERRKDGGKGKSVKTRRKWEGKGERMQREEGRGKGVGGVRSI